jgi:hypothetical protein
MFLPQQRTCQKEAPVGPSVLTATNLAIIRVTVVNLLDQLLLRETIDLIVGRVASRDIGLKIVDHLSLQDLTHLPVWRKLVKFD